MVFKQLSYSSLFIGLLSATALLGCQTHNTSLVPIKVITSTPANNDGIISDPNASIDPIAAQKLPELSVDSLNRYEWQLVQWVDAYDNTAKVAQKPAFTMDVRPSSLVFKYDCQRYLLRHDGYQSDSYSASNITNITNITPNACSTRKSSDALDIAIHLKRLFPEYGRGRFHLALLPARPPSLLEKIRGQSLSPRLAINVNDSQLVFTGTLKPIKPISGLPINYDLLERYGWRLIKATDSDDNVITALSHKEVPVSADFRTLLYKDIHSVGFYTGCNGIGGSYILTPNHELLIGAAPQTMVGCSDRREAAEDKIRMLELLSKSQLVLTKITIVSNQTEDKPTYQLNQKLDSGDTLTWQSDPKKSR